MHCVQLCVMYAELAHADGKYKNGAFDIGDESSESCLSVKYEAQGNENQRGHSSPLLSTSEI